MGSTGDHKCSSSADPTLVLGDSSLVMWPIVPEVLEDAHVVFKMIHHPSLPGLLFVCFFMVQSSGKIFTKLSSGERSRPGDSLWVTRALGFSKFIPHSQLLKVHNSATVWSLLYSGKEDTAEFLTTYVLCLSK